MAVSTWKTYQRAQCVLLQFLKKYGFNASLPLSPSLVALFVTYLFEAIYAASTICTYVAAINFTHKLSNLPEPGLAFVVQKAIQGAQKSKPKLDMRLPITKCILHKMVDALEYCSTSGFQRVVYKSMFLLAFAAFLRVGEMTVSNGNTSNVLKREDVYFSPEGKNLIIIFRAYKHSGGRQKSIKIERTNCIYCPVKAFTEFLVLRKSFQSVFLFCWASGRPVQRVEFAKLLESTVRFIGLDPQLYKGHSFRIGAACNAFNQGCSDAQIRQLGRWRSDAFKAYIRV